MRIMKREKDTCSFGVLAFSVLNDLIRRVLDEVSEQSINDLVHF